MPKALKWDILHFCVPIFIQIQIHKDTWKCFFMDSPVRNCSQLMNSRSTTLFSHFFGNYINMFYKTEVQKVILSCYLGLSLDWLKSYDTKCKIAKKGKVEKLRKLVNSWKKISSVFKHFYEYFNEKLRYRDGVYFILKLFAW